MQVMPRQELQWPMWPWKLPLLAIGGNRNDQRVKKNKALGFVALVTIDMTIGKSVYEIQDKTIDKYMDLCLFFIIVISELACNIDIE